MKKIIAATMIAAAAGLSLGVAAPAQACAYNSPTSPSPSAPAICGLPNLKQSVGNSLTNLKNNFSVSTAVKNLQHNLTHGVGSDA